MSSPAYLIPMLSSVLVMSASVYSSKRLVASSVKMTYGAVVYKRVSHQFSVSIVNQGYVPGNEDTPCSCTALSGAGRRCGR